MTLHSTAWLTPFTQTTNALRPTMTLFIPASISCQLPSSAQLKAFCRTAAQRDYGRDLERICRGLAIAIAFTYACGYALGCWLHQTNDQLSGFSRQFNEPDWHQQRLAALRARLAAQRFAVRETACGEPQAPLSCAAEPQATPIPTTKTTQKRTTRSKLPTPAAKPSRKRSARKASATTAAAAAA